MKKITIDNSTSRMMYASTLEAYNTHAAKFAQTRNGKVPWQEFESLLPLITPHVPLDIADIGCGSGRFLGYLQAHAQIRSYMGLDYSEHLIQEAIQAYGHSDEVIWKRTDMQELELGEEKFDLIVLIASFHHLLMREDQQILLQKIYRALTQGGILFMTNWNLVSLEEYASTKIKDTQVYQIPLSDGISKAVDRYYYGFQVAELEELFSSAGFVKSTHSTSITHGRNILSHALKD